MWADKKERWILFFVVFWLLLLCIVESNPPSPTIFVNTFIETVLTSDAVKNIVVALASGIVSAYLFYIAIDLWPRKKREESIYGVLDSLLAFVIVEKSFDPLCGYDGSIRSVDRSSLLTLEEQLAEVKKLSLQFEQRAAEAYTNSYADLAEYAMEFSRTKIGAFKNVLPLVLELSPNHALYWMSLTEKIELLAGVYEIKPVWTEITKPPPIKKIRFYRQVLLTRYQEVLKESIDWMNFRKSCNKNF